MVLVLVLLAITAVPRLVGLGKFTSIDEPFWLRVSGNFYHAITRHEFQNTLYEYHPAVTTMWIIAAGLQAYFPDYRILEEQYLKPGKFDAFLVSHGKSMLQLLIYSRAIQVIVIIILLLLVYFLLRLWFSAWTALFTTAFMSISPFFLGHSRLLNHEAMLALFQVISLLGVLVYVHVKRSMPLLLLSGAAGALAQLTKSSGFVLIPLIGLAILVGVLLTRQKPFGRSLLDAAGILGLWLVALAAAYVLFWPGMWVAPGQMLSEVYGNALTYVFSGTRDTAVPGAPGAIPLDAVKSGLQVYLPDLAWRMTPLSWLGVLVGVLLLIIRFRHDPGHQYLLVTIYALILGALFVLLFSTQRGPKPPHYIVTTYLSLDLIAGLGLSRAALWLAGSGSERVKAWLSGGLLVGVLALQGLSALGSYPYYISYYDPLVEALQPGIQNPTLDNTGYGVGLDQAAAYLAQKPGASQMVVLSANGLGSFSYYFPGTTTPMNNYMASDPEVVAVLKSCQYVVVDYHNQVRNNFAGDLQGVQPEKIIWINGIDFLHIYRAADLLARLPASQR